MPTIATLSRMLSAILASILRKQCWRLSAEDYVEDESPRFCSHSVLMPQFYLIVLALAYISSSSYECPLPHKAYGSSFREAYRPQSPRWHGRSSSSTHDHPHRN